jgi:2,5-diketo-D-gluconate reductase A
MEIPAITLNDGHSIPQLGFGLYRVTGPEAQRVVEAAIEVGYRHFDGAALYGNEVELGRAITGSGIPRDEFYVTTKLWRDHQGRTEPLAEIDRSLERLGLEHVDLYLIHWPHPRDARFLDTWFAFEEIKAAGKSRSIGVSNFRQEDLAILIAESSTTPAVNQVELHPRLQQRELRTFHDGLGIRTESWGPLGHAAYSVSEIPELVAIGAAHGKSPQQVVIRWLLQEGIIVFPKSSTPSRIAENFDVFGFELRDDEIATIRGLDRGQRVGNDPSAL